jgi:hypothetical protein
VGHRLVRLFHHYYVPSITANIHTKPKNLLYQPYNHQRQPSCSHIVPGNSQSKQEDIEAGYILSPQPSWGVLLIIILTTLQSTTPASIRKPSTSTTPEPISNNTNPIPNTSSMSAPPHQTTSPNTHIDPAPTGPTPTPSSSMDNQVLLPISLLGPDDAPSNNHPSDTVHRRVSQTSTAIDSSPSNKEHEPVLPQAVLNALEAFDFKAKAVEYYNTIAADNKPSGWTTVSSFAQLSAVPVSAAAVSAIQHAATTEQNILLSSLGAKYGTKIFDLAPPTRSGSPTSPTSASSTSTGSTSASTPTDPLETFKRADVLRTLKSHTTKLHGEANALIRFPAHRGPGGVSGALTRIFERIAEIEMYAEKEHVFEIPIPVQNAACVITDDDGIALSVPASPSKKIVTVKLDTPTRNHFARESIKVLIKLSTLLPQMPGSDVMGVIGAMQSFIDAEHWEAFLKEYVDILGRTGSSSELVRAAGRGVAVNENGGAGGVGVGAPTSD